MPTRLKESQGQKTESFRILLVGPLPPPIGGDTTLFTYLVDDLKEKETIRVFVVNISRGASFNNWLINIGIAAKTLFKLFMFVPRVDLVSFHANMRGRILFGPFVYWVSRGFRKPIIMRAFGGAFADQFRSLGPFHQWLLRRTYFNSDVCLFETKKMVEYFRSLPIRRAEWFSNYTRSSKISQKREISSKKKCKRFVFLGQVKKTKGIDVILDSVPFLSDGVTIDIYGPLRNGYTGIGINSRGQGKVFYRGILNREQLEATLWEYDSLVLPSMHPGEGYPGVVLEAYARELPVIVTDWISIPEIVDEKSGILIKPGNVSMFAEAVNNLFLDDKLYIKLAAGAKIRAKEFSDIFWTDKFLSLCHSVFKNGNGARRSKK